MIRFFLFLLIVLCSALPAQAGQSEAREVARLNNCPPKKIEIYQSSLGATGKTIYQVTCTLPKTVNKDAPPPQDTLLIECDQSLCDLIRPISSEKK